MLQATGITLRFGGRTLFEDVNIKFTQGNCYGIIGANGAGKSTFLKILSGDLDPSKGEIFITPGERLAVLKQDHFEFDEHTVLKTVIMGHKRLYDIMQQKEELYGKEDFSDEDGILLSELEGEFAELNGWEAESQGAELLMGLGIDVSNHDVLMKNISSNEKVRVLLAQALFGNPDILLLDEPTNHLDLDSVKWLENFIMDFENTVIVVSHDRYFLNKVCTHIADVDFGKIQLFVGNYDFWYESSQLAQKQAKDQNKKTEQKMKELQEFIRRFSANASKSKQATSRKKLLENLTLEDIRPSSRKYPFVGFDPEREAGNDLLLTREINKTVDGENLLNDVSFIINKGEKVVFLGHGIAKTTLFNILMEEDTPDSGEFKWGVTTSRGYFPKENSKFFDGVELSLVDWMRQYSKDQSETYVRGFLGRMLFSGEEALKKASVLSGGEKVRCMLSRMMLSSANVLIFDEPTNHLDLESITALNNGLMSFKGTILFTSHDHQFVQTVANRIIEITPGGIIDKNMEYDEYIERDDVKEQRQELYAKAGKEYIPEENDF